MGLRIPTNVSSLVAQQSLARHGAALGTALKRLSTGLRINSAADDPGGLGIAERLRAQVRSLDQAQRNANDGISLVQAAEGALGETSAILSRLRELAVQSKTGSLTGAQKDTLNTELQDLVAEIDRIARATEFNGIKLLDGSASSVAFQVGIGTVPSVDSYTVSLSPALSTTLSLSTLDIGSAGNASLAVAQLDTAISTVTSLRGRLGAAQNRLQSTQNTLAVQSTNLGAAESRIRDADFAQETANLTRAQILQQAATAILAQANSLPALALRLV